MTTEGKDETGGLDPGDDQALWALLGRHEPPVRVSPYFARRVLREVTLGEPERGESLPGWRRFWNVTARHTAVWSGAVALGMLCLSAVWTIPASRPPAARPAANHYTAPLAAPEPASLGEVAPVQDEELIADLDDLLSREESRLWTEDTDTARF